MANVDEYLQKIMSARYGEEVRGSIHDAIQAMNVESTSAMDYAKDGAESAQASAQTATEQVDLCKAEVQNAKSEVGKAKAEVTKAGEKAVLAESYAHGGTGTRAGEDSDNAKYYMEQAKSIASGGLIPMGSLPWAEFKLAQADASTGFMYHITDEYYIDDTFEDYDPDNQENNLRPAGSEVYLSANGKWETTAGREVAGIRLEGETEWKRGHVEIPKATANGFGVVKGEYDGYLGEKEIPIVEFDNYIQAGVTWNADSTRHITASGTATAFTGIHPYEFAITEEMQTIDGYFSGTLKNATTEFLLFDNTNSQILAINGEKHTSINLDEYPSATKYALGVKRINNGAVYVNGYAHAYINRKSDASVASNIELSATKLDSEIVSDSYNPLNASALKVGDFAIGNNRLYKVKNVPPNGTSITDTIYFEPTSVESELSKINVSFSDKIKPYEIAYANPILGLTDFNNAIPSRGQSAGFFLLTGEASNAPKEIDYWDYWGVLYITYTAPSYGMQLAFCKNAIYVRQNAGNWGAWVQL